MSYAYAIQPPAGLGLLPSQGGSFLASTIRKEANSESSNKAILRKIAQQGAPTAPAAGAPTGNYDIFDRFRDFWNFIKHGVTLLWYKGRAAKGYLNNDQWKAFQDAATGLANNRTFKDVYGWWYGPGAKREFQRFEQLPAAARNLMHFQRLRESNKKAGLPGVQMYFRKHKLQLPELQKSLDYYKRYGYITDAQHKEYSNLLPLADANTWQGTAARRGNETVEGLKKGWGLVKSIFAGDNNSNPAPVTNPVPDTNPNPNPNPTGGTTPQTGMTPAYNRMMGL